MGVLISESFIFLVWCWLFAVLYYFLGRLNPECIRGPNEINFEEGIVLDEYIYMQKTNKKKLVLYDVACELKKKKRVERFEIRTHSDKKYDFLEIY